jgi:hypothetical protein
MPLSLHARRMLLEFTVSGMRVGTIHQPMNMRESVTSMGMGFTQKAMPSQSQGVAQRWLPGTF